VGEPDALRREQQERLLTGEPRDLRAEPRVGGAHRVHRPADGLDQPDERREDEALLPRAVQRDRVLTVDAGAVDEPVDPSSIARPAPAPNASAAARRPRAHVIEALGGQEVAQAGHRARRALLVVDGLEGRSVARVGAPPADQPHRLALDEVRQRARAAGGRRVLRSSSTTPNPVSGSA
jgi:hypothetical protein